MTGEVPFPKRGEYEVATMVSNGKRPSKPRRFNATGMTPAVWKIAEKCWRQKAEKRPEVSTVLKYLEDLAKPGMYAREACPHL